MDPELGESSVVGGSRASYALAIMGVASLGYLAWGYLQPAQAGGTATVGQTIVIGLGGIGFCVGAVWTWRTQLVIGRRGFRYVRPFRRVQASWTGVGRVDVLGERRSKKLIVPLLDGGRVTNFSPQNNFSTSLATIADLMNARRADFLGPDAQPAAFSDAPNYEPIWPPQLDMSTSPSVTRRASGAGFSSLESRRSPGVRTEEESVGADANGTRAGLARLVSAGGAAAYAMGGGARIPIISRWPIVPLLVAAIIAVFGLSMVEDGVVGMTNPSPVSATIQQVDQNNVSGGSQWVTVSGLLQEASLDASSKNEPDRVYLIVGAENTGLLVRSKVPLGEPGAEVTVTGLLLGRLPMSFVYTWDTVAPWSSWAKTTFPAVHVPNDVALDADQGPPSAAYLPFGAGIILIAVWLVVGCLAGYVVFLRSRSRRAKSVAPNPDHPAWVRVTGVAINRRGTWAHWRETPGEIKLLDHASGARVVVGSSVLPAISIDPGAVREAQPGTILDWRWERPAIRLVTEPKPIVLSFDDIETRDSWLSVFGRSIEPNVIRG